MAYEHRPCSSRHWNPAGSASFPEDLLLRVEKPARYIGGEVNAVRKDPASVKLRIALAFPDVYEMGMSHLGLKVIYSVVNRRPDLAAERAYAVWPDAEEILRREGRPLRSLETGTCLADFDIVGFSLQYELCATNVLQMLDLGHIPLRSNDRIKSDPFVIAGGPVALNPVPLSPFVDAFAIGEAEDLILEMADAFLSWKEAGGDRLDLLRAWKRIEGVFVPVLHQDGESVSRRIVADLNTAELPIAVPVPFCEIVHDRVGVEIARGCTRGCRFCQAGMIYRPVRERETSTIIDAARRSLELTGFEEVALLSLSSGDYSEIGGLVKLMAEEFTRNTIALSLPSLRTETLDQSIAEQIRKVRKTGFTLAPEAGTDRLRRIINKGNTEDDLERAVSTAFNAGWQSVKLYFMIGLPFETDEDLDGIADLVRKASRWARGGKITVSVSTFVPKSHTPFQWAEQISLDETLRRQHYIRRFFGKGRVKVKFHDPRVSFLEGVLARGDGALSDVIEHAYKKGARFDGWDERLSMELWMKAFEECGIEPGQYLKARPVSDRLPWDFISTGISKDYLVREWQKAHSGDATGDCRFGDCEGCGVCDFERIRPRKAAPINASLSGSEGRLAEPGREGEIRRFRLRYGKLGLMRFLGHRDLVRTIYRAFRRAGLRLAYSKGFHPHPKLRFSLPLSVGIESYAEYLEFDLIDPYAEAETILSVLSRNLPDGIRLDHIEEIFLNDPSVSARIQQVTYEIRSFGSLSPDEIRFLVKAFKSASSFAIRSDRKGKVRNRDLKEHVLDLAYDGSVLSLSLAVTASGAVTSIDALAAILGMGKQDVKSLKIVKTSVAL